MAGPLLKTATIRDFSGGWNVADNPHNLSSKYLPISDNIMVGVDGALSPRMGYKLFADLKQGITQNIGSQAVTINTLNGKVRVSWTAHPFNSGEHITFNLPWNFAGTKLQGTYGVVKIDANTFDFYIRSLTATSAGATPVTFTNITRDTHMLGGNILDMAFFQGKHIIFSDMGEICAIDENTKTITRIWDASLSVALAGAPLPWRMSALSTGYETVL